MACETCDGELADLRKRFRRAVRTEIVPFVDQYEREERIPRAHLLQWGKSGWFGALAPAEFGGLGLGTLDYGILAEEIGAVCASALSIVTVHAMVLSSVLRWGTAAQKNRYATKLSSGTSIGAFALTESGAGSDTSAIETSARPVPGGYILNGHKKWVSGAQIADVFLVMSTIEGQPTAFLVDRDAQGLAVSPTKRMSGFRAAMLGDVALENCQASQDTVLGRPGTGLSFVANSALDLGRYSIAFGALGLATSCLAASLRHAEARHQGKKQLRDHQLIQEMLANCFVEIRSARDLCCEAARRRGNRDPTGVFESCLAKYKASRVATQAAAMAVQIHGAVGLNEGSLVARLARDAPVFEIIEGSSQIQVGLLAQYAYHFLEELEQGDGDAIG